MKKKLVVISIVVLFVSLCMLGCPTPTVKVKDLEPHKGDFPIGPDDPAWWNGCVEGYVYREMSKTNKLLTRNYGGYTAAVRIEKMNQTKVASNGYYQLAYHYDDPNARILLQASAVNQVTFEGYSGHAYIYGREGQSVNMICSFGPNN
jgi:hypothetical protein